MSGTIRRRAARPWWALVVCPLLFGGCGSPPPAIAPSPLAAIASPPLPVRLQWRAAVGAAGDYALSPLAPAVVDGVVYAAAGDGELRAFDLADGRRRWRTSLDEPLRSGVAADADRLYLAARSGDLIALSRADGSPQWRAPLGLELLEPATTGGERVVVRASSGEVIALDPVDGARQWRFSHAVPDLSVRGAARTRWISGGYLVPLDDGRLVALDERSGRTVWETQVALPRGSNPVERIADLDTEAVLIGERVFVGSRRGDVAALDGQRGALLWRRQLDAGVSALAAAGERLLVVQGDGELRLLDAADGVERWHSTALRGRRPSAPAVIGELAVLGDLEGYVHWVSLADGALLARARVGKAPIDAAPLAVDGGVVVLGRDGELARLGGAP